MPKATSKSKQPKIKGASNSNNLSDDILLGDDDVNLPDSQHSSNGDLETPVLPKSGKKRSFVEEEPKDVSNEMQKLLECFGSDITKTMQAKKKRLEQFTQVSLKTSSKKVDEMCKVQKTERCTLSDEFQKQITAVFTQWETDLGRSKEQEDKLQNLLTQQQKLFQQTRVVQSQRLKTIKQLHEQYTKGMKELDQNHLNQQTTMQTELKKEMALLQKKILMDTQQQEMANVRKSLQTMLF